MVVDTVMQIGNKRVVATKVATRPRPTFANLSGDAMRHHEQIMDYRHRVNALSADLDSAIQALSAANAEIARLRKEVADLTEKLASQEHVEKEVPVKSSKARKGKKSSVAVEAVSHAAKDSTSETM